MFTQAKNTAKLLAQQSKIKKILTAVRAVGTSANGKVRVIMSGEQKVIDVEVDPEIMQPSFVAILQKSIKEAFEDAMSKVQEATMEAMKQGGGIDDFMSLLQAGFGGENGAAS